MANARLIPRHLHSSSSASYCSRPVKVLVAIAVSCLLTGIFLARGPGEGVKRQYRVDKNEEWSLPRESEQEKQPVAAAEQTEDLSHDALQQKSGTPPRDEAPLQQLGTAANGVAEEEEETEDRDNAPQPLSLEEERIVLERLLVSAYRLPQSHQPEAYLADKDLEKERVTKRRFGPESLAMDAPFSLDWSLPFASPAAAAVLLSFSPIVEPVLALVKGELGPPSAHGNASRESLAALSFLLETSVGFCSYFNADQRVNDALQAVADEKAAKTAAASENNSPSPTAPSARVAAAGASALLEPRAMGTRSWWLSWVWKSFDDLHLLFSQTKTTAANGITKDKHDRKREGKRWTKEKMQSTLQQCLLSHGDLLFSEERHPKTSDALYVNVGLAALGTAMDLPDVGSLWWATGEKRFMLMLKVLVDAESHALLEQSPAVHHRVVSLLFQAGRLGFGNAEEINALAKEMHRIEVYFTYADRTIVEVGAEGNYNGLHIYSQLDKFVPRYPRPAVSTLRTMKNAGFASVRGPKTLLFLTSGMTSKRRKTADDLSFVLEVKGQRLVAEAGALCDGEKRGFERPDPEEAQEQEREKRERSNKYFNNIRSHSLQPTTNRGSNDPTPLSIESPNEKHTDHNAGAVVEKRDSGALQREEGEGEGRSRSLLFSSSSSSRSSFASFSTRSNTDPLCVYSVGPLAHNALFVDGSDRYWQKGVDGVGAIGRGGENGERELKGRAPSSLPLYRSGVVRSGQSETKNPKKGTAGENLGSGELRDPPLYAVVAKSLLEKHLHGIDVVRVPLLVEGVFFLLLDFVRVPLTALSALKEVKKEEGEDERKAEMKLTFPIQFHTAVDAVNRNLCPQNEEQNGRQTSVSSCFRASSSSPSSRGFLFRVDDVSQRIRSVEGSNKKGLRPSSRRLFADEKELGREFTALDSSLKETPSSPQKAAIETAERSTNHTITPQQFSRPKEEERTERTAVEEEESRKGGKQQSSGSSSVKESAVAEERSWKSPSVDPFEKERAEKAKEEGVDKESEDEKAAEEKEPSPSPPLEKDEEKTPEERVDQNEAEQSREQQTIGTIASTPSPFPSPTESPETTGTDAAEKETATARESGQVRFQTEALPKALSFRLPQPNDPFSARGIALVDGEPTAASQLLTHAFLSSSPSESDVASDNKQSVLLSHSLLFDFSDDLHVKVLEMNASIPFNIGERRVEAPSYFFLERDGAKRSDGGREEFQKRQPKGFFVEGLVDIGGRRRRFAVTSAPHPSGLQIEWDDVFKGEKEREEVEEREGRAEEERERPQSKTVTEREKGEEEERTATGEGKAANTAETEETKRGPQRR